MFRRTFFAVMAAVASWPFVAQAAQKRYGRITVEGWDAHFRRTGKMLRIFVDGHDVTTRCVTVDDRHGYALMNKHDDDGRCYIDARGKIAREIRKGANVRIVETGPEA